MDPSSHEYKITKDIYQRNTDLVESIRKRKAAEFGKKYKNDPDYIASDECFSYLNAARVAMEAPDVPRLEGLSLQARGSLCLGKLFRSPKYGAAVDCMTRTMNNPEPCMDIMNDLLNDTMETREQTARQNMPRKVREVNEGLYSQSKSLFAKKRMTEEQVVVSSTAYVLYHYCQTPFVQLMSCARTNSGDTSKCRMYVERSIDCLTDYQLENMVAMMRPPKL
eukprot:TRINITY_DN5215_c0_g1_i3.p1 TRINITY_DN5215_c0_g1~~TRINITY_DN5215_c0_g1_i3.p1  ORF type:complete len:222 (-),score=26.41 TRINITY_DN5215_c0_g1_i3:939-1604(-)